MSPARRLPILEPGSLFYTVDVDGRMRQWRVEPDGRIAFVEVAPLVLTEAGTHGE